MRTFKISTNWVVAFLSLMPVSVLAGGKVSQAQRASVDRMPAAERHAVRVSHAKELLGKHYGSSGVRAAQSKQDPYAFIRQSVLTALPAKHKKSAAAITRALIREAYTYKFDPLFLVAVIKTESSFNPEARGTSGEIGLMHIMPATGEWMAKRIGMKWNGPKTLKDPASNIRLGAAYFAMLRERFDSQSQLYLAAYNMGVKNVNRALDRNVMPKEYPSRVMHHYVKFYTDFRRAPASS
jgi:soluble lytic murein transglycosylase